MTSTCPLCYDEKYQVIYENPSQYPGIAIVKCASCHHLYTFSEEVIESSGLYNDNVYKVVDNRKSIFDRILGWEYGRVLEKINRMKPSKGWLLDFGSGKGKFASLAKKNGWNVRCVETAVERAAYAREVYDLEVDTSTYHSGRIADIDFDVLTLFHVLEHLKDPKLILNELIRHNLTQNAIVVIEVPNSNSWQAKIAGRYWMHWDQTHHISHFSPVRLEEFTSNLELVRMRTNYFSFHLGVLGMTDSILKRLGYRKNIIAQLKNSDNKLLIMAVITLLPFSLLAELIASVFGKGGVIRKYLSIKPCL